MSGVVGRPFRRAGSGSEVIPEGREWSGGHHGGPEVVGRPSEGREWLGGPFRGPGVVGRPSQRVGRSSRGAGSGPEALTKGRK